jgi:tellurite resistance protein TehA-like permease
MAVRNVIKNNIQSLFPASFALVMATGIISIASHTLQYDAIANTFFLVNVIAFIILLIMFSLRLLSFFSSFKNDLSNHEKGAGFLTFSAGASILGNQFVLLKQDYNTALVLWIIAWVTWALFLYSFFILTTIKKEKPSLENAINGSWLLIVVSTQSLSILGTQLIPLLSMHVKTTFFISVCFFLTGTVLYGVFMALIIYRMCFFSMRAEEFKPSYWIDMGAAAISTLAALTLAVNVKGVAFFQDFVPLFQLMALLFWAISTWWLPVVIILEIWQHKKKPLQYRPGYWSLVFPLGMYSMCTAKLSETMAYPFLHTLAKTFLFISLIAWIAVFLGMCFHFFASVKKENSIENYDRVKPELH